MMSSFAPHTTSNFSPGRVTTTRVLDAHSTRPGGTATQILQRLSIRKEQVKAEVNQKWNHRIVILSWVFLRSSNCDQRLSWWVEDWIALFDMGLFVCMSVCVCMHVYYWTCTSLLSTDLQHASEEKFEGFVMRKCSLVFHLFSGTSISIFSTVSISFWGVHPFNF